MIRTISSDAWSSYNASLPKTRKIYEPALPANLPYQGHVGGDFDYVLSAEMLERLRQWLQKRGEESVYYFLTESIEGEPTDFEVPTSDLTPENLVKINKSHENAIVGKDFRWALFIDHEGALHVSGPPGLMTTLSTNPSA